MSERSRTKVSVAAKFHDRDEIQGVIAALRIEGFSPALVSAAFALEPGEQIRRPPAAEADDQVELRGTASWFTHTVQFELPGNGPLIATGPLSSMIEAEGGSGTEGVLSAGLIGIGLPARTARDFEEHVREGGSLAVVHCDDSRSESRAIEILENNEAMEVIQYTQKSNAEQPERAPSQSGRVAYLVLWLMGAPVGLLLLLWVIFGNNLLAPG